MEKSNLEHYVKINTPTKEHYHEIMDRTHIINSLIDSLLFCHPGLTEEMSSNCELAQKELRKVHQEAAYVVFNVFKLKKKKNTK